MANLAPRPTLATARLALREPRPDDAPALARLVDDLDVARMTTAIPHPYSLDMAEAFLARMARRDRAREALFAIDLPGHGFAGLLGFHPADAVAPAETGYWLGRPYWGNGYMTEALSAALAWAGEAWGKRVLAAGHFADNPASGQVLIKAGFLYTGDVEPRFSLARGEATTTRMMVWLA
jgi:RimJ/RimL family protein N-acetyltransferase